jgi:hypothetical protein
LARSPAPIGSDRQTIAPITATGLCAATIRAGDPPHSAIAELVFDRLSKAESSIHAHRSPPGQHPHPELRHINPGERTPKHSRSIKVNWLADP